MNDSCTLSVDDGALGEIFLALEQKGCEPRWTADGRGIVSDCPNCGERRALLVEIGATDEVQA